MRTQTKTGHQHRTAFTLLELLIVIVIISILAGLLFVAFGNTMGNVRVSQTKAEFAQMEVAMKSFETEYGVIPPSSIVLTENPGLNPWTPSARSTLRRMFGANVDFTQVVDFNKDGDKTDLLRLTSSECLVFFLGGMPDGPDGNTLTGFSRNQEKPFARLGSNRVDPQYTFDVSRLIDADDDGMREYRDLQDEGDIAIIYASSNNGQGYDRLGEDKNNNNVLDVGEDTNGNGILEGAVAHYYQSDAATPWKQNSFQLISPGTDGEFGFEPEPNPFVGPTWSQGSPVPVAGRDNITNFAPGILGN